MRRQFRSPFFASIIQKPFVKPQPEVVVAGNMWRAAVCRSTQLTVNEDAYFLHPVQRCAALAHSSPNDKTDPRFVCAKKKQLKNWWLAPK